MALEWPLTHVLGETVFKIVNHCHSKSHAYLHCLVRQATVSAFKGFSGFTSLTANKPAAAAPSFNFGITSKSDSGGASTVNKTSNDPPPAKTNDSSNSKYVQQLKRLNESVTQWIKDHVDRNPYCILTPIFRDYERYLDDLEKSTSELSAFCCGHASGARLVQGMVHSYINSY